MIISGWKELMRWKVQTWVTVQAKQEKKNKSSCNKELETLVKKQEHIQHTVKYKNPQSIQAYQEKRKEVKEYKKLRIKSERICQ